MEPKLRYFGGRQKQKCVTYFPMWDQFTIGVQFGGMDMFLILQFIIEVYHEP